MEWSVVTWSPRGLYVTPEFAAYVEALRGTCPGDEQALAAARSGELRSYYTTA